MIDWNFQSPAHACQACEKPFLAKAPYHTLLFDERHGYSRIDVCEGCWDGQYRHGASDRKGFVSHWLGEYAPPPDAPPEPIAKETAESLLRRLIELNDPRHQRVCYILAVMLERKRLLKVQSQMFRDGQREFIYEHPKTGDLFSIVDPNVELGQIDELQREVAHLLEHGLHPLSEEPKGSRALDGAVLAKSPCRGETIEVPASDSNRLLRTLIFDPFMPDLDQFQRSLNHLFHDPKLLRSALTHPSVAHESGTEVSITNVWNSSATRFCNWS